MAVERGSDLCVIGNVNADVIVRSVSSLPPPGAERVVDRIAVRTGGAAANAALTLSRLGSAPMMVGCVGDDHLGSVIREELVGAGLGAALTTIAGTDTGVSVALEAPGRDRSFLTSLGSLASFETAMVPAGALTSPLVLVCGYFLLPMMRGDPTRRLLEKVRASGGKTLFDCGWSPEGWPARTREEILSLLPYADVFLPNRAEVAALSGEEDARVGARALQRSSGSAVVVKLGREGCLAQLPDDDSIRVAAPVVEAVDSIGAGDAFNAGLLHALARSLAWHEALSFATRVASTVVARASRDRHPRLDELLF